ncbi:MAG: DNA polymerase III subunit beta, partial [Chloroflexota bacterium]
SLIIDTEAIRYKWRGADGTFPDYQKLIPTETNTVAHFDAVEALKAIGSLRVLADSKAYPINITLDNGYVVLANIEDKGQTAIAADIEGKPLMVRLDGNFLAEALKACGGMVDFRLTNAYSPTLFTVDGYQLVVMPMQTSETSEAPKRDRETGAEQAEPAKAEAVTPTEPEPVTEPVAEATVEAEAETPKPKKRKGKGKAKAQPTEAEAIAEAEAETEGQPEAEAEAIAEVETEAEPVAEDREPVAV